MVWGENYVLEPILKAWNGGSPSTDGSNGDDATGSGATAANTTSKGDSDADKMAFYTSNVLPILQDRCYECHGNGKHKGGLSMDVRSSLVSRDSDGIWIVQPGDPAHSLMIERCLLPAEDDEAMPPKGDRLKATELEALRTWIAAGAVMPATSGAIAANGSSGVRGAPVPDSTADRRGPASASKSRSAGLPALSDAQVAEAAALRGKGINAVPISVGASTLSVSIPGGKGVGDADISALIPIAAQIEELSFARASVSDAGMMQMPSMPFVRSVRVDNTALTDVGITVLLSRTLEVETVNLVSSGATDGVFTVLAKLPRLQRVYVFDTQVTAQGIDRFRATHPGVDIVVGSALPGTTGAEGPPVGP
jgi:mono/diheme cytochrome c family protein